MAKHGKKYTDAAKLVNRMKDYAPAEAVELLKQVSYPKFNSTIEVHVRLGVDPRHANQQVRSAVLLPAGLGKTVRILVFAEGDGGLGRTGRRRLLRPGRHGRQDPGRLAGFRHGYRYAAGDGQGGPLGPHPGHAWPDAESEGRHHRPARRSAACDPGSARVASNSRWTRRATCTCPSARWHLRQRKCCLTSVR